MSEQPGNGFFSEAYDFIFGKSVVISPEENVKKWQDALQKEKRNITRQIRTIQREQVKIQREITALSKKGDRENAKTLVKELIRSRKQVDRMHTSIAQINSVSMQLRQNLATYKMVGAMKRSTDIMKALNDIVKVPELQMTMMTMAKEMEKAGLIDEIVGEALGDEEELSEEADEEVTKILDELVLNFQESTPSVGKKVLNNTNANTKQKELESSEEDNEEDAFLRSKIQTLG
jgi:charged multivesicular body protein 3